MGVLYLVATPIGNLGDITLRALETLKKSDLIVCEDTRRALKLLGHYDIRKPLESFHEGNEIQKVPEIVDFIHQGKAVSLLSDAGTPSISDPGYRLVTAAIEKGIRIAPLPGPSAVIAALAASGSPTDQFVFVGFLPQKQGKRRNFLESLRGERRTIVAFESPNRLLFTLKDILEVLGDVWVCVAREMTKIHEDFFRGAVTEAIEYYEKGSIKGEVTLVFQRRRGRGFFSSAEPEGRE